MNGSKPISVLIFGSGAVGTYVGGSLALAGHRVVFIEQPAVAAELRAAWAAAGSIRRQIPEGIQGN